MEETNSSIHTAETYLQVFFGSQLKTVQMSDEEAKADYPGRILTEIKDATSRASRIKFTDIEIELLARVFTYLDEDFFKKLYKVKVLNQNHHRFGDKVGKGSNFDPIPVDKTTVWLTKML